MASEIRKQLILQDFTRAVAAWIAPCTLQERWQELKTWRSHAVSKMLLQKGEKQPGGPVAAQLTSPKWTKMQLCF